MHLFPEIPVLATAVSERYKTSLKKKKRSGPATLQACLLMCLQIAGCKGVHFSSISTCWLRLATSYSAYDPDFVILIPHTTDWRVDSILQTIYLKHACKAAPQPLQAKDMTDPEKCKEECKTCVNCVEFSHKHRCWMVDITEDRLNTSRTPANYSVILQSARIHPCK